MTFEEYQAKSRETAIYPTVGHPVVYPTLGLAGEAGEVAEKIKKLFRDENGKLTPEYKLLIEKELGDILWYVSQIAFELDIKLQDVATTNLKKLQERKANDKLHGSGDSR